MLNLPYLTTRCTHTYRNVQYKSEHTEFPLTKYNQFVFHTEDQQQQERLILEQDILEVTEDQPPAASGQEERETEECTQTEYAHLEEEKQNEMNICPPESAQAAPKCGHNTSQEQEDSQGACVAEEASNRCGVHFHPFFPISLTENKQLLYTIQHHF